MPLTAEKTKRVIAAAEAKATEMGHKISIAVVDSNGLMKGFLKMDEARFTTHDIARGKAMACAGTGLSNGDTAERAARPVFQYQLIHYGSIFAQGGEPLFDGDEFIGAIGVSGAPGGPIDEEIAKAAVDA